MKLPFTLEINGKPNYFIEKIWLGLLENGISHKEELQNYQHLYKSLFSNHWDFGIHLKPKLHTIRRGERWSLGMPIELSIEILNDEFFNFAPEINCISIQKIETSYTPTFHVLIEERTLNNHTLEKLVINDGFENVNQFKLYFNSNFKGQIIHWTNLSY